jgi:hypothetical protein
MTTTTTRPKVTPTGADITKATADLDIVSQDGKYAFATGYLGSLIGSIAESHRNCRTRDCMTCWHIRRGLALVAALDATNPTAITGGTR